MTSDAPRDPSESLRKAAATIQSLKARLETLQARDAEPIAIVGMGCRFPGGAASPDALWQLLRDGVDAVREVPRERWDVDAFYDPDPDAPGKTYTRAGTFLDDVDRFDADFFGIAPREAKALDPQHRVLLETSWAALEDAGIVPGDLAESRTGVFVGIGVSDYAYRGYARLSPGWRELDIYAGLGTDVSFSAGRLSYVLGLQGPSLALDTACSSSLVALHLACQSLRAGECEVALAGGVALHLWPLGFVFLSRSRALAPDGRCKAFAANADGFGRGEGCGVLVLKRLSRAQADGDRIWAVVRGSAVAHDGASSGITAPNGTSQRRVLRAALEAARLTANDVGYVEAHGTGTPLGDPIEVEALAAVYGERTAPLRIGSIKTNLGHLEAAAGVAGVIKAVLAMRYGVIPRHLHADELNPHIAWDELPVRVTTREDAWPAGGAPRRAGVSAFGMSGTNAHVILEEAPATSGATLHPAPAWPGGVDGGRAAQLLTVSAIDLASVRVQAARVAAHLRARTDLALGAVARSLATARTHFAQRVAVRAETREAALEALDAIASGATSPSVIRGEAVDGRPPRLAFLYTGQGAQRAGAGARLYETEPVFRAAIDRCAAVLDRELGRSLIELLFGSDGTALDPTAVTQPALFALAHAQAELWRSWGVTPAVVAGHSVGEYAAACAAGVMSFDDGLRLIVARGRLMQALPTGGAMVSIAAPAARVAAALAGRERTVSIAALNGPEQIVIAGVAADVHAIADRLAAEGVRTRALTVSHAFHSPLMEPMLDDFRRVVEGVRLERPKLPLVSNLSGALAGDEVTDPSYWVRHAREPVRFADAVRTLVGMGVGAAVEVGPQPVLVTMAASAAPEAAVTWVPSLRAGKDDVEAMLDALGQLHVHGVRIDHRAGQPTPRPAPVELPTYGFARERHWLDEPAMTAGGDGIRHVTRWRARSDSAESVDARGRWLVVGDRDSAADAVAAALVAHGGDACVVDTDELATGLAAGGVRGVVHAIGEVATGRSTASLEAIVESLRVVVASTDGATRLSLVTRRAVAVGATDETPVEPAMAALWGLGRVASLEHAARWGALVDVPATLDDAAARAVVRALVETAAPGTDDQVAVRASGAMYVPRIVPLEGRASTSSRGRWNGTALITGGAGGLGGEVAAWAVAQGARHVVLTSRRGAKTPGAAELVARLEAAGARVTLATADAADRDAMAAVIAAIDADADLPLCAVLHLAGINTPSALLALDRAAFEHVLAAKAWGAAVLDELIGDRPLDAFVMFSSIASAWGAGMQGAYAAANAFVDGVVARRRAAGRVATAVQFGPWSGAGMAVGDASDGLRKRGLEPQPAARMLRGLEAVLDEKLERAVVAGVDWPRFRALYELERARPLLSELPAAASDATAPAAPAAASSSLVETLRALPARARTEHLEARLAAAAAEVLGWSAERMLDRRKGFFELGMDSLMALELRRRVQADLGVTLAASMAFNHPNVEALTQHLLETLALGETTAAEVTVSAVGGDEAIAIVGMGCRMPGGVRRPADLWRLLATGRETLSEVPAARWDAAAFYDPNPDAAGRSYVRHGSFLDEVDRFDAAFFGITPREARALDPQHRLLLETSWEALEDAGLVPSALSGTRTGVFVGIGASEYAQLAPRLEDVSVYTGLGTSTSFAAGRLSFVLGLQGPSLAMDTACSSSLVALHLACQSLRAGECRVALAGGVSLMLSPIGYVYLSRSRALSPDGRCKTFSAQADGYGRGEGCGVLVLKRLRDAQADGDRIWAVVRGTAVAHDGASSGLTTPNGRSQEQVLRAALAQAGLRGSDVAYVEAHGTGTALGDPIEVEALTAVYGAERAEALRIGSIKTNIGHLEAAAGVAGVMKVVLSLAAERLPAHLHAADLSPHIPWDELPVAVTREAEAWPRSAVPRRAGVSAFGLSGTNAHVILEEAPVRETAPEAHAPAQQAELLMVSARSAAALRGQVARLAEHMSAHGDEPLDAVAAALATTRSQHAHRLAVVARDRRAAIDTLEAYAMNGSIGAHAAAGDASGRRARVAFLFSGQGSQHAGMGAGLYERERVFRETFDRCARVLDAELGGSLRELMFAGDGAALDETWLTQAALYALEVSLATLWQAWGVEPAVVLGHSIGEYAAACVAGVFSVEHGARLVATRGRLMQGLAERGAMISIGAREADVAVALAGARRVTIAAVNGPEQVVISGDEAEVERIGASFAAHGARTRRLTVSHAFHSPLMEPMLEAFAAVAATVQYAPPSLPLVSNVDGHLADARVATAAYWVEHVRAPVRFAAGVTSALAGGVDACLEIGPRPTLVGMAAACAPSASVAWLASLRPGQDDATTLREAAGRLFTLGATLDGAAVAGDAVARGRRVELPTYAFARERYWIDTTVRTAPAPASSGRYALTGTALSLPGGELHHVQRVSAERQPYLGDHVVHGQVVVPGAFYLAAVLAMAFERLGATTATLSDVEFVSALVLHGEVQMHVALRPDAGRYRFTVSTAPVDSDAWTTRAQGWLETSAATPAAADLAALRRDSNEPVGLDLMFDGMAALAIEWGPRWRFTRGLHSDGRTILAELADPTGAAPPAPLHPSAIDNGFAVSMVTHADRTATGPADPHLPFAIRSMRVHRAAGGTLWCHGRPHGDHDPAGDLRTSDLTLWNDAGEVVVEIDGFLSRRAPRDRFLGAAGAAPLYEVAWQPLAAVAPAPITGRWAVWSGSPAAAETLRRALVAAGADVVASLDAAGPLDGVLAWWDASSDADPTRATLDGLALLQAIAARDSSPRVVLATPAAEHGSVPARALDIAALWGLGRVASREHPAWRLRLIEVVAPACTPAAAMALVHELAAADDELEVVIGGDVPRRGARLVRLAPQPAPARSPASAGSALVTGGLGALGLLVARWLVEEENVPYLVLVGRRPPDASTSAVLEKLRAQGATIEVAQADVADRAALAAVLAAIPAAHPLRTVIHAAGVLDDGVLGELAAERVERVLAPKVTGAWNLDELTRTLPLDRFVMFSAAAAVLGGGGQGSYAAANAFLDALARTRRAGGLPAVSVAWGPWAEAGMAAGLGAVERARLARIGLGWIAPADAPALFRATFDHASPALAVLPLSIATLRNAFVDREAPSLLRALVPASGPPSSGSRDADVPQVVTAELARVTGIAALAPTQSLRELGIDSLMAMELRNGLAARLGLSLPATLLFDHPTVEALIAFLESARGTRAASSPAVVTLDEAPPLSAGQARLWFLDQLVEKKDLYHIHVEVELRGALDVDALTASLAALVARHEALRTRFEMVDDVVRAVVDPPWTPELSVISDDLEAARRDCMHRPFDLARDHLVRFALLQHAADHHRLCFTQHHIITDAWSIGTLLDELGALYLAATSGRDAALPPLHSSYAAFARREHARLRDGSSDADRAYWIAQLAGVPTLQLPTDRPRARRASGAGDHVTFAVPPTLAASVGALARDAGTTLFATLYAAYGVLLHRLSGQADFAVGTMFANRNDAAFAGVAGFFVNTVALRCTFDGDPTFAAHVARTGTSVREALAHHELPYDEVVRAVAPARTGDDNPIFQTMFAMERAAATTFQATAGSTWHTQLHTPDGAVPGTSKFELTLTMVEHDGVLEGCFEYASDLFDRETVERMAAQYTTLLATAVAAPETAVSRLAVAGESELARQVETWNATARPGLWAHPVHEQFVARAAMQPDAVAVVCGDERLTYGELDARSNQVAHALRARGVGPEALVGVCVERGVGLLVALLGVLKAGGAYVPLDPYFPRERQRFMLEDSGARLLVTDGAWTQAVPATVARIELVATRAESTAAVDAAAVTPATAAYVIYTSGSTGTPKGVVVTHGGLSNFLGAMADEPGLAPSDVLVAVTTLSFDIAGLELYLPLVVGARVVVARREEALDVTLLADVLAREGATVLQATPATWSGLREIGWNAGAELRALCGGEALPRELAGWMVETCAEVWNLYGPTETTIWSTVWPVTGDEGATVPIGRPIANTQVYVLDRHGAPVAIGAVGELHIGGAGVARGYLGRAELTAERFVADLFSREPSARLYRTGDLARWRNDGTLEYVGRADQQVKLRGFRIELGEIEAVLAKHADIAQVVVDVREDRPGEKRLVAYVVAASGRDAPTVQALQERARTTLPEYMVPNAVVVLDALPLTPNGKVDRRRLPAPTFTRPELASPYTPPQHATERALATIWQAVLDVERVGIHDSFFELGGHSALAVRVRQRIVRELGRDVALRDLFERPTIAALAAHLDGREAQPERTSAELDEHVDKRASRRERLRDRARRDKAGRQ